jgi:AcrR family transcriptional regulator
MAAGRRSTRDTLNPPMTADPEPEPKRRGRPPSGGREAILTVTLELLRERGIARLTTREVAARAGVSEASVFYHYSDRAGLLKAVFAAGMAPLKTLNASALQGEAPLAVMTHLGTAVESFLDQVFPVLFAAQSDADLRESLAAYMAENDLGPHRGVQTLSAYLAAEQQAGRIRADVDPDAVAMLLISSSLTRVFIHLSSGRDTLLPDLESTARALDALLRPGP